jgi:hypothetical protein
MEAILVFIMIIPSTLLAYSVCNVLAMLTNALSKGIILILSHIRSIVSRSFRISGCKLKKRFS